MRFSQKKPPERRLAKLKNGQDWVVVRPTAVGEAHGPATHDDNRGVILPPRPRAPDHVPAYEARTSCCCSVLGRVSIACRMASMSSRSVSQAIHAGTQSRVRSSAARSSARPRVAQAKTTTVLYGEITV